MDEGFPFSDFQLKPFMDPKPVELPPCFIAKIKLEKSVQL